MSPRVEQDLVLIVNSTRGNSPNVAATDDGGAVKDLVGECLWHASEVGVYGRDESTCATLCDNLSTCHMRDWQVKAEVL